MKGTKVDGIYDSDPVKNPQAKKYTEIPFLSILTQNLKVMTRRPSAFVWITGCR